jgi:hypothetical protein
MEEHSELIDVEKRLSEGLELVIDGSGARWRLPGRRAIRFEVERARALRILRALSGDYHTRHPRGRHVLTPEAKEETSPEASDEDGDAGPVQLWRQWHTVAELADLMGCSNASIRTTLDRHDDKLDQRRMTAGLGEPPLIVRSTHLLAVVLQDRYGEEVIVDVTTVKRTPVISSVRLDQQVYTRSELGEVVKRSRAAVGNFSEKYDLTETTVFHEAAGREVKALVVDEALVAALKDHWDLEVTVTAPARSALAS